MSTDHPLRHPLHLSIDSSPFLHYADLSSYITIPDLGSPPSSGGLSTSSSSTASCGDWKICSVLCLHDFSSDDPSHLSFAKNEILDILRQEDSGWWAALRPRDNKVGWISSAYVEPLSDDAAETLRRLPEHQRVQEYDASRTLPPVSTRITEFIDPMSPLMEALENHKFWRPNITKTPAHEPDTQEHAPHEIFNNLVVPNVVGLHSDDDSESDFWSPRADAQASHTTLLPQPVPRVPFRPSNEPISSRPSSVPPRDQRSPAVESHSRSQSETVPHRHLRRRPMFVDDRSSLHQLSTLIESHNTTKVDILAPSPVESIGPSSRLQSPVLRTGLTRTLTFPRDDQLHSVGRTLINNSKYQKLDSPWFLLPSYNDDDFVLDYDGTVKAATLSALVERLTLGWLKFPNETKFRHTFLTTFRTFSGPDLVFDLIVDRYRMEPPGRLTPEEYDEWKEKKLRPTQHQVLTVLTMWLEDHNMVREDPHIVRRLRDFLLAIRQPQSLALTANLMLQAIERLTCPTPLSTVSSPSAARRRVRKGFTTELVRMDVIEVAQQLCLLEQRLYSKIRVGDCFVSRREINTLAIFWSTHDKLVSWVTSTVLNADGVRKKADIVDFWIHCADICKAMNNISSMNAIITAMTSDTISPFDPIWDHISRRATLDALSKLSDPVNDFASYKSLLQSVNGPCVPYVGVYLAEINRVRDRYPDTIRSTRVHNVGPLINFFKRQKWADIVESMLKFQSRSYTYAEAPHTMGFIEGHLVIHDPNAFWNKSLGQVEKVPEMSRLRSPSM